MSFSLKLGGGWPHSTRVRLLSIQLFKLSIKLHYIVNPNFIFQFLNPKGVLIGIIIVFFDDVTTYRCLRIRLFYDPFSLNKFELQRFW